MSNIPVPEETAANWATFAERVRNESLRLRMKIIKRESNSALADLMELHLAAAATLCSLRDAGAPMPEGRTMPEPVPLHLMDTDANRRLYRALCDAYEAAQDVDRERGQEDVQAFAVALLMRQVQEEVCPPTGRGE